MTLVFFCFGSSFCMSLVSPTTSDLFVSEAGDLDGSSSEPVDLTVPFFGWVVVAAAVIIIITFFLKLILQ